MGQQGKARPVRRLGNAKSQPLGLLRCLAQALLGLSLGLVVAEGGLRVVARAFQARTARTETAVDAGLQGASILCHGDSNVFGIYLPEVDSYPAQLERLIRERCSERPASVINAARPGITTGHVLRALTKSAEAQCVVVTAGVNNSWSWIPEDGSAERPWYESLRLAKFLRIVLAPNAGPGDAPDASSLTDPELATPEAHELFGRLAQGIGHIDSDQDVAMATSIEADLIAMHERLAASNRTFVLSTYGADSDSYALANRVIRKVASERGIPLADATRDLLGAASRMGRERVYFDDQHPRAIGYQIIARHVFNTLVEIGVLDAEPIADPAHGLCENRERAASVELILADPESDGDGALLEVRLDHPGFRVTATLSGLRNPEDELPAMSFPTLWERDALFRATLLSGALTGMLDSNGTVRIPLPAFSATSAASALSGKAINVHITAHSPTGRLSYVSPAITLQLP